MDRIDHELIKLECELEKIVKEIREIRRNMRRRGDKGVKSFSDDSGNPIWW